jgi:hypothetical protein
LYYSSWIAIGVSPISDDALSNEQQRRFEALRNKLAADSASGSEEEHGMDEDEARSVAGQQPHHAMQPPQFRNGPPQLHPPPLFNQLQPPPFARGGPFGSHVLPPPPHAAFPIPPPALLPNANSQSMPQFPPIQQQLQSPPVKVIPEAEVHSESEEEASDVRKIDESEYALIQARQRELQAMEDHVQQQQQHMMQMQQHEQLRMQKQEQTQQQAFSQHRQLLFEKEFGHLNGEERVSKFKVLNASVLCYFIYFYSVFVLLRLIRVTNLKGNVERKDQRASTERLQSEHCCHGHGPAIRGCALILLSYYCSYVVVVVVVAAVPFFFFFDNLLIVTAFFLRLALVNEAERRMVFEGWMRSKTNERIKKDVALSKKQLRQKQEEDFKEMLVQLESKLTHKTTYEQVADLCKEDERCVA